MMDVIYIIIITLYMHTVKLVVSKLTGKHGWVYTTYVRTKFQGCNFGQQLFGHPRNLHLQISLAKHWLASIGEQDTCEQLIAGMIASLTLPASAPDVVSKVITALLYFSVHSVWPQQRIVIYPSWSNFSTYIKCRLCVPIHVELC